MGWSIGGRGAFEPMHGHGDELLDRLLERLKLLEEAQARKLVELEPDDKSCGVIIKSFSTDE